MAVEAMNSDDSWKGFGDVYAALERDICRRTYKKCIKPVVMQSSKEIGEKIMMEALDDFRKEYVTSSLIEWRVVCSLNRTQGCRNSNKVIYSKSEAGLTGVCFTCSLKGHPSWP